MRGWLTIVVALWAVLAGASGAHAAPGTLTDASDAGSFPHRTWVLSLPGSSDAATDDVEILENGAPVADLLVTRSGTADAGGRPAATMLLIDASNSMAGAPIEGAMRAARAFADARREGQALGVVLFNGSARVLLRPTTDERAIDAALRRAPDLALHTHIGLGVDLALQSLADAGADFGSIVVLSDGDDTGDPATMARATRRAALDNVRIFTVGLRSQDFAPGALEGLAAATGGAASVADSPRDVRGLFSAIARRLRAEYQVSYRSNADPGARVRVEAHAGGGPAAVAEYRVPAAPAPVARGTTSGDSFWASTGAVLAVMLVCILLVGVAAALVLHRPAGAFLPDRIAAYAEPDGAPVEADDRRVAGMASIVERVLSASGGRWQRFVDDVDVARVSRSASEYALAAGAAMAGLLLLGTVSGARMFTLLGLLLPVAVVVAIRIKGSRERARFGEQLPDNLQVFASALRAGHSFSSALGTVADDAPEPTHRELHRALNEERMGGPIDEALARIGRRMRNAEMSQVAMIAALQQQTGGNTAEVLDRVVENVRERQDLRRLVKTLTAQGRMSQLVVTSLPFALAGMTSIINPGYLSPLFESAIGWAMIVVALVMIGLGSLSLHKIVRIRV